MFLSDVLLSLFGVLTQTELNIMENDLQDIENEKFDALDQVDEYKQVCTTFGMSERITPLRSDTSHRV